MRIAKERQDARIRITKIEIAIEEALPPEQDYTELVLALLSVAYRLQNQRLRLENPSPNDPIDQKDDDERNSS